MGATACRTAVCTIVSKNYLHYARTLMASLRTVHPDWAPYVLLVDEVAGFFDPRREPFRLLEVGELPLPQKRKFLFRYTLLELNTAVKPWFLEWLFREEGVDRVVYLDPDIFVYRPLREVEAAFDEGASLVLTPHLTGELRDGKRPSERDILKVGCYNLGFCAMARDAALDGVLPWWQDKLEFDCRVDMAEAVFVDQKWMDLAPSLFDRVCLLRHPGYNLAYWNLAHRRVEKHRGNFYVNGQPLTFYHFSGLNPIAPEEFSKHQDRFRLADLGPARELVESYCAAVLGQGVETCRRWPYAFATWADGTRIPDMARLCYQRNAAVRQQGGDDPFHAPPPFLNAPWGTDDLPLVTNLMRTLWEWRRDLPLEFPDPDHRDRANFAIHFQARLALEEKISEFFVAPVRESLERHARVNASLKSSAKRMLRHYRQRLKNGLRRLLPAPDGVPDIIPFPTRGDDRPTRLLDGINIVGYVRSEHGVGESARLCAQAAAAAGLPFSVHDYNVGNSCRATDSSWAHRLDERNRHVVNVCHINADQLPVAVASLGRPFFAGHYNVGFWHWEMPEFPDASLASFRLIDEVWVPTRYVQDAVSRKATVPVVRIPHGIRFRTDPEVRRADLGLPGDRFLFLAMYDTQSIQARKNPQGVIESFRRAFPDNKRAGLVLKINNPNSQPQEVAALKATLADLPGVVVLDQIMTRQDVYNLEGLCDCFVSLHRSEGFGLGLAESMFLGKPVIGTHWSGNVDFMDADNSCPVRFELVKLEKDHGPYQRGQHWAEPDLDHAAWYMTRLVEDEGWRNTIAARGRQTIHMQFSPEVVGALYRQRLRVICEFVEPGRAAA